MGVSVFESVSSNPSPARTEALIKRVAWSDLDPAYLRNLVVCARDEDLGGLGLVQRPAAAGDRSTDSVAQTPRESRARLVARETMVVCGLELVPLILSVYGGGAVLQPQARDGQKVERGAVLGVLSGSPRVLLAAERVILNFLQRLTGIATQTHRYVETLGRSRTRLLDTRKTTPGWRMLEKYAVAAGGGWNHRLGLFDRVMLKDNHLALLGSDTDLAAAVARARRAAPELPVEVEVDRMDQIPPVLAAGADVILLDNFPLPQLKEAIALIAGRAFTEASGGITLATLPALGELGLDFISTGALVHQSTWVDIGLDWNA